MKNLILILVILMTICLEGYATPENSDTAKAGELFFAMENTQNSYLGSKNTYEQIKKKQGKNKYYYQCDVYDGPKGKGYVLKVIKAFNKKVWVLKKHVGPETWRDTNNKWTKKEVYYL